MLLWTFLDFKTRAETGTNATKATNNVHHPHINTIVSNTEKYARTGSASSTGFFYVLLARLRNGHYCRKVPNLTISTDSVYVCM